MFSKKFKIKTLFSIAFLIIIASSLIIFRANFINKASTREDDTQVIINANSGLISLRDSYKSSSILTRGLYKNSLLNKAASRKARMLQLIKNQPDKFLLYSMPKNLQESMPSEIQTNIEKEMTISGDLVIYQSDDFKNKISNSSYELEVNQDKKYSLYFTDQKPNIKTGSKVKVKGVALDNLMALDTSTQSIPNSIQVISTTTQDIVTTGIRKTAVIMINFQNNTSQPYTNDYIREKTFTGSQSVNAFYKENSYNNLSIQGKLRTDGDIFGYYTIPYNIGSTCATTVWSNASRQMATNAGVDLTGYDSTIYAFNVTPSTCSSDGGQWAGVAELGGDEVWIMGSYYYPGVVSHEIGHNIGFMHANGYNCKDPSGNWVPLSTNCTSQEYADFHDDMGFGYNQAGSFAAARKIAAGWLPTTNEQLVNQSGIYDIYPLETASQNIQNLKINWSKDNQQTLTKYLQLEYRVPSSSEPYEQQGVYLREVDVATGTTFSTNIINAWANLVVGRDYLMAGTPLVDPVRNITFNLISTDSQKARVEITFGPEPCNYYNPAVIITPERGVTVKPGTQFAYTVTVTNNNPISCPATTYDLSTLFMYWTKSFSQSSLTIPSGGSATSELLITSPSNANNGVTWFQVQAFSNSGQGNRAIIDSTYWIDKILGDITPPSGNIVVNDNASETNKQTVNLKIEAQDNSAGIYQMRLSNNGTLWQNWESYNSTAQWNITDSAYGGDQTHGTKTVYAQFKDRAGNISSSTTDTIFDNSASQSALAIVPVSPLPVGNLSRLSPASLDFVVTFNNPAPTTVTCSSNGAEQPATYSTGPNTYTCSYTNFFPGTYNISITGTRIGYTSAAAHWVLTVL